MSRNRVYQITPTQRHTKPLGWLRQEAAQRAERETRTKPRSWWTAHAAPDSRESFIDAAKRRTLERDRKWLSSHVAKFGEVS